jgi:predicted metalloprotease
VRRLLQSGIAVTLLAAAMAGCDPAPQPAPEPERGDSGSTSSLEGAFAADSIDEYLDIISGSMLTPWFRDTWPDQVLPEVGFVPAGGSGTGGCAVDDESLAYCAADQTVYIGQTALWNLYRQAGDAGPVTRLGYEFGLSVTDDATAAYCLAGTWVRYADHNGWLEPDDEQDIATLFQLTGTGDDQRAAFQTGRADGVSACGVAPGERT